MTPHSFPLVADTERNGPDTNHQVWREWMSRKGGEGEKRMETAPVGEGQGVRSCFISLAPFRNPNLFFAEPPE